MSTNRARNLANLAEASRRIRARADAEREAAAIARSWAENHTPARLLGVAQVAIETALRTNDLAEVHAQLEAALARIKPTEVPA